MSQTLQYVPQTRKVLIESSFKIYDCSLDTARFYKSNVGVSTGLIHSYNNPKANILRKQCAINRLTGSFMKTFVFNILGLVWILCK